MDATAAGRFAAAHGHRSYADLHAWSIDDLEAFWSAVSDDLGVRWHGRPTRALAGASMPGAAWFLHTIVFGRCGELSHGERRPDIQHPAHL